MVRGETGELTVLGRQQTEDAMELACIGSKVTKLLNEKCGDNPHNEDNCSTIETNYNLCHQKYRYEDRMLQPRSVNQYNFLYVYITANHGPPKLILRCESWLLKNNFFIRRQQQTHYTTNAANLDKRSIVE